MTIKEIRQNREQYIKDNFNIKNYTDIGAELGLSGNQVSHIAINKLGLHKGSGHRLEHRTFLANDSLFDKWTRDNVYILGFIVTDGHIEENRNRITIGLGIKDIELLTKIKDIISPQSIVRRYTVKNYECCELRFTSKKICEFFRNIGLHHNKTGNEPLLLDYIPFKYHYDYLRGIIDGDGCIYYKERQRIINHKEYICKDHRLSIVSKNLLFLQDIQSKLCSGYGAIINQKTYYTYQISTKEQIIEICKKIYYKKENKLYLQRKYDKYLAILGEKT